MRNAVVSRALSQGGSNPNNVLCSKPGAFQDADLIKMSRFSWDLCSSQHILSHFLIYAGAVIRFCNRARQPRSLALDEYRRHQLRREVKN